ncbi:hypothetical protein BHM03_00006900 [Ensete ventricosum]|nr:hypothetical protein BHM03_00006900 [Ensete ventricosum]
MCSLLQTGCSGKRCYDCLLENSFPPSKPELDLAVGATLTSLSLPKRVAAVGHPLVICIASVVSVALLAGVASAADPPATSPTSAAGTLSPLLGVTVLAAALLLGPLRR